jgi:hypothetical protein
MKYEITRKFVPRRSPADIDRLEEDRPILEHKTQPGMRTKEPWPT